ncbi:MAG: UDP-glucose/GDP-mannose dehydrogenase family protein [Candidatus Levyibacteriota bacterium]
MTITFVGHGYVGLVTASVFADLGNKVWVIGHTPKKIENLKKGIIPIYEPGLEEIVKRNVVAGRLNFTLDYSPAVAESDIVFIAVGTPSTKTGDADLRAVLDVAAEIGKNLKSYTVIATKSTVPAGTNKKIRKIIEEVKPLGIEFDYASVPEFLREGQGLSDTLHPDRIVIGTQSKKAQDLLVELHKVIGAPFILTDFDTAELIKYAANSFLALKISYANAISKLSELAGADGLKVLEGIGMDKRIGDKFLSPGPGYGGSCFPKDVKALVSIAKDYDYDFGMLTETEQVNSQAKRDIVRKLRRSLPDLRGKTITMLGLSFKPDTDDMRDAPAIDIIELLQKDGAKIKAYDPQAMEGAKKVLVGVEYEKNAYDAVKGADAVVIMTEWNEFKKLDLEKIKGLMKEPFMIDARNIYDLEQARSLGFNYIGVGR